MSQLNIGLGYRSDTSHGQDFKPFFIFLFLCTIPIFEGYKITLQRYKMIEMQIQGWRRKGFEDFELSILLHFHRFWSSSLICHFTSNITFFFHDPSLEELILDIILRLSQFFILFLWFNKFIHELTKYWTRVLVQYRSWSRRILLDRVVSILTKILNPIWALYFFAQSPFFKVPKIALRRHNMMKMQRVWRLWALHIFSLSWASIFFPHPPSAPILPFFPSPITRRA